MKTLRRALALAALAALTACGGSGGTTTPIGMTPGTTLPAARTPDARGTLTLRFPAHIAKAQAAAQTARNGRAPAYINPTAADTLVIKALGTAIVDPSNPGNSYFSLSEGTAHADGSRTLTVPLVSGNYNPGDLTVTEYDGLGSGNALAYGYNSQYTDVNGAVQNGAFTLTAGGIATPVITMAMNVGWIVVTTDPVAGSDATLLSQSSGSPSPFGPACFGSTTNLYVFAADLSSAFVLPGITSGYTGGDGANAFPGVPNVSLQSQFTNPTGGEQIQLRPTIIGGNVYRVYNPTGFLGTQEVTFQVNNPLGNVGYPYPPFGYTYSINGYVTISEAGC